jgi:lipopolysaccharide/colanic/teichoic acid biosynthesis glycosyltransferase
VRVQKQVSAEPIAETMLIRGARSLSGIRSVDRPIKQWNAIAKWFEDRVLSTILLLLFAPAIAIIALAVKLNSRGPVFYVQDRVGFDNKVIRVFKFRTMYAERCDISGARRALQSDPRITRIGGVLRRRGFDELPQLINVLRGDMSLVGPRPRAIAMKLGDHLYRDLVENYQCRHRVKPGITGWAQVSECRGPVDTLEKARAHLERDLYYIEHWSLWFDLKILGLTVPILLQGGPQDRRSYVSAYH